jgi:ABC-type sugar transport system ATPase subunit
VGIDLILYAVIIMVISAKEPRGVWGIVERIGEGNDNDGVTGSPTTWLRISAVCGPTTISPSNVERGRTAGPDRPQRRRQDHPLQLHCRSHSAWEENLKLGAFIIDDEAQLARRLEYVYEMFPRLKERLKQAAGSLSGGEQQMLAIGRGLMSGPKLLMLDEPSLGLAPLMVSEVFETVRRLRKEGLTVLLVEQNVREALELTDQGYILQTGRIRQEGASTELLKSDMVREAFLGM